MIKVAVYDDNKSRRESLQAFIFLSSDLEFAGSFENSAAILKDVTTCKPDVILIDIEMPGGGGIAGVAAVKQHFPQIKIIMQTAFDDDDKVFAALQAGAERYILKTASIAQIAQSIDEVMQGGAAMKPSIALKVMSYFEQQQTVTFNDYKLSPKENEVLKKLATGLSYKMIADEMGISYFTVNNQVK